MFDDYLKIQWEQIILSKILEVIESCENERQLEITQKWAGRVIITHNLPLPAQEKIARKRRAKKVQLIKKTLATKHSSAN